MYLYSDLEMIFLYLLHETFIALYNFVIYK